MPVKQVSFKCKWFSGISGNHKALSRNDSAYSARLSRQEYDVSAIAKLTILNP